MAKIDDYKLKYVGTDPGQISLKEFQKISDLDVAPHSMVPWMIKLFIWLKSRIGKINSEVKDEKDALKILSTIIGEFKTYRHILPQKDFNFYDYPTLAAELAEARLIKLKKEINKIEGAILMAQDGDKSLYLILTMEAAQKYGAGTKWCIAATRSQSMWSNYTSSTGRHRNVFFFVLDLEPRVENQEKVAIQVENIHIDNRTGGVSYSLKFWNTIDNPFDNYPLPESFRNAISNSLKSKKDLEDYDKLKNNKEKEADKIKAQSIEAEKIRETFKNPAMYIMSDMPLPKTWVNTLIPPVRVGFKSYITTLHNIRHASSITIPKCEQIKSLGDLEDICDILDIRSCPNITEYKNLKRLYGTNEKGEEQEAEVWYDNATNRELLNHINNIIEETGKGILRYAPGRENAPNIFKPDNK